MQKVTKAVIPCAGFGTRFLPATKAIPKEMFPIIDTPSLQLIVKECVDSGITDVLIIISKSFPFFFSFKLYLIYLIFYFFQTLFFLYFYNSFF